MPTNPRLKVENLYEASLTADVVSPTGDVTLSLNVAPAESFGFLVIDPNDAAKRETCMYHAKSGYDVSVYSVNRKNGNTHSVGAPVKMLNLAEIFNAMSSMVSWTFFAFQRGPLDITVNGGPVAPGLTAPDADITVGNGTTYLWYKPSDNTVNFTQSYGDVAAGNGIIFATVVAGGGSISSITYERFLTGSFLFSSMRDVAVSGVSDGQILEWDAGANKWVPGSKYFALTSLTDVDVGTPTDGYVLSWDAGSGKYVLVAQPNAFVDAPSDGNGYVRMDGSWVPQTSGGGIPEAPIDGAQYARKDGAWSEVAASGMSIEYKTADFTVAENYFYVVSGTINVSFPVSASVGSLVEIFVRSGSPNVAGTSYPVPGTIVRCVCESPSTWSRHVFYPVSGGAGSSGQVLKSGGPSSPSSFQDESAGSGGVEYVIADYSGPAMKGVIGKVDITRSRTAVDITLVCDGLPVGSNCVCELRKNSPTGSNICSTTLQITTSQSPVNGRYVGVAVTSFTSASLVSGDVLYLVVTDPGSTVPAMNLLGVLELA